MSIWNVKVEYLRPCGYDNLEEWCKNSDNVYIGRKGIVFIKDENGKKRRYPPTNSVWANPYKVGKDGTLIEVLLKYKTYIEGKIQRGECDLSELHGKNLGCWCKRPDVNVFCHGDILMYLMGL